MVGYRTPQGDTKMWTNFQIALPTVILPSAARQGLLMQRHLSISLM
jgi:hypothetical protein